MNIQVEFFGLDEQANPEKAGVLSFDGKGFQANPESLLRIVKEPVVLHGEGAAIDSMKDPVKFMESLHLKYRSPYFRASQATQV